jgi:hypothetical protein
MTCSDFLDYYGIGHFVAACITKIYDIRYSQQSLKGNANQSQSQPAHYRDIHSLTHSLTHYSSSGQTTVYCIQRVATDVSSGILTIGIPGPGPGRWLILGTAHTSHIYD